MEKQTDRMKKTVTTNRLFSVFRPRVYGVMVGIVIVMGCVCIKDLRSGDDSSLWIHLMSSVFGGFLGGLIMVYFSPKQIIFGKDEVEFDDYCYVRPLHLHGNGFWWLKVSYSVSNLKDVTFTQNKIEKRFDVGRITFSGKAVYTAKRDVDRIKEKTVFCIYGIKNFSEVERQFNV